MTFIRKIYGRLINVMGSYKFILYSFPILICWHHFQEKFQFTEPVRGLGRLFPQVLWWDFWNAPQIKSMPPVSVKVFYEPWQEEEDRAKKNRAATTSEHGRRVQRVWSLNSAPSVHTGHTLMTLAWALIYFRGMSVKKLFYSYMWWLVNQRGNLCVAAIKFTHKLFVFFFDLTSKKLSYLINQWNNP